MHLLVAVIMLANSAVIMHADGVARCAYKKGGYALYISALWIWSCKLPSDGGKPEKISDR
ncbi:hypothetical protein HMPREF3193_01291 [Bifidobacterium breve]|nr:hypothetical protein HMPREF1587_00984 [Bifidobacterium breve JCP7499]KWZ84870.1 hypothetical protein HMPREF3193_01291 [Bifidobacterium breve]